MRYAIIEDGIVENIALADAPLAENWIEVTDGAVIGGTWDGKAFGPIPEADTIAAEIEAAIAKDVAEAEAKRLADLREAVAAKYSGVKTAADIMAIKGRK